MPAKSTKSQAKSVKSVKSAKSQAAPKTAKSEMQKTEFKSMAQSVRTQPIHKDAPPDATLVTDPDSVLVFSAPFNETKVQELKIKNTSTKKITYKMKSTNRQRFKAGPSNGYIEPQSEVIVHINCKPFELQEGPQRRDRITVLFIFTLKDGREITPKTIDQKLANKKTLKIQYLNDQGGEMEMRTVMEPMNKAGGKSQMMSTKSKAPKTETKTAKGKATSSKAKETPSKGKAAPKKGAPPKKK